MTTSATLVGNGVNSLIEIDILTQNLKDSFNTKIEVRLQN